MEGDGIRQDREKGRRRDLEGKTKFPDCNMLPLKGPDGVIKVPINNLSLALEERTLGIKAGESPLCKW